jgi:hypothetical protein
MAIAKNPHRNQTATVSDANREARELAFIQKGAVKAQEAPESKPAEIERIMAVEAQEEAVPENKKPIMVRVDKESLKRIDRAAKRRGISRSAFMVAASNKEADRVLEV